jgi:predicted aspartyl protease
MKRFRFPHSLDSRYPHTTRKTDNAIARYRRIATRDFGPVRPLFLILASLLVLNSEGLAKHSDDVQEVPFKLYMNHIVVAVGSLGGQELRNLVIDTGTNPTIVDYRTAKELGLEPVAQSNGSTTVIDGLVPTYYSVLPNMDLGAIHCESMQVAVADLSWLREQAGVRADAVIGLDALAHANFEINYDSRKIRFGAIRLPRSAVPMSEDARLLTVPAKLNGFASRLMIDTGGSSLILFAKQMPRTMSWRDLGKIKLSNLAGQSDLEKIQLDELSIGGTNLTDSIALVANTPTNYNFQGVLGISARQFKRVMFDFRQRRVGFELQDTNGMASAHSLCDALSDSAPCPITPKLPRVAGSR